MNSKEIGEPGVGDGKDLEPPYLICAVFCDQILTQADQTVSAIRIVDKVTLTPPDKFDAPQEKYTAAVETNLLVTIKSGGFIGEGEVKIVGSRPSGAPLEPHVLSTSVEFRSEDAGVNLLVGMRFSVKKDDQGIHLFEIYFNDQLLTRTPLSAYIAPIQNGSGDDVDSEN